MRSRTILVALLLLATSASVSRAQTQYWDLDIVSQAGAGGTSPAGVWNSFSNRWNSDSTGLGIPTTWSPGSIASFAAGTTATGAYTVTVSGTQSLSGLNVDEGVVSQSGGTLDFGSTSGAPINIASGAAWGQNLASVITGTGGIIKNGGGTLYLRGTNPFSKSGSGSQPFLAVNGGVIDFVADANLGAAPSATDNGAALSINGGTLRYTNTANFSLAVNRGVFVGTSGATFEIVNSATLALPAGAPAANTLTGSGTITKSGIGRFRLQTAQTTFTGKYVVKGGSLTFPTEDRLGAIPATTQADYFTLDGGGLYGDLSAGTTLNAKRGITLGPNGGYLAFVGTGLTAYDGIISGTQGGALSVATTDAMGTASSGTVSLNSANTYNGPTLIASGMTLSIGILAGGGVNSAIGSSSNAATNLVLDGGTLQYRGAATTTDRNFTITAAGGYIDASGVGNAPLTFTNTAPIALNGAGLRIFGLRGTSTGDNTLSQSIADQTAGATTLNKLDAGTWVLKNTANSYTGSTVISGGRLKLGASGVIPDLSLVQLFTGATLDCNGFDETVRSVSGTGGTLALGSKTLTLSNANGETYSGAITGSNGRILKNGAGKLTISTAATYDGGITTNAGKLGIGTNFALGSRYLGVNNSLTISPVVTTALVLTNSVVLNGNVTFDDYSFISNPGSITWTASGTNQWTLYGGDRTIVVSSVPGTYGVIINQPVGEDVAGRDLIKGGNGLLALNGVNTYTGDTWVQGGILRLGKPSLADSSKIFVATGGSLNLTFPANTPDTITALYLEGMFQPAGTWGAIGSGAEHESALITGTGRFIVAPEEPPTSQQLAGDFNNDGKVDAGDYATWRKANGTNNALLNDNGLGTPVGLAHLELWQQHYGDISVPVSSGSGINGGTIPEPNTMMLFIIGLAGPASTTSRRKR